MGWGMVLGPLVAAVLAGGVVAAVSLGRREALASGPRLPLLWGVAGLLVLAGMAAHLGLWALSVDGALWARALGGGLVLLAAWLAHRGSRAWRRAERLLEAAPRPLEEAVQALREGRSLGPGVWRGRLGASEEVTSPGGVVCAFYEAELRRAGPHGRPGPLLSRERAWASVVLVRGERVEAAVSVSPASLLAPVQVRRCSSVGSPVALEAAAGEVPPPEAFSHERVGKLGEPCLVVGEVVPGPVPGRWRIQGPRGGPATLLVGPGPQEALAPARELARRGWLLVAASALLCAASAFLLAR